MTIYRIETSWSGYSRGVATHEVEADSEEEACEDFHYGLISRDTVREDIEYEIESVKVIPGG